MFSRVNSCSSGFQQQFSYTESQYPQPENPINFNQMNPRTCQNGFHNHQFLGYSETPSPDSGIFPENRKTRFQETGVEESEVVDELIQVLVECLKKGDIRKQEILLRKFFFEIEKEISLERFLIERIKHSKINFLLSEECLEKIPGRLQNDDRLLGDETGTEISTRELVDVSSEEETSEKLDRFKVKTIQVGEIVKEEEAR